MTHMDQPDYDFQSNFVIDNAWRLLAMQDDTSLSPSFGCFDLKYWRDKTSEFADARFQEASLTLALLSLPAYDIHRAAGPLPDSCDLYAGFRAGLRQWHGMQYSDGSFDEWYKGERGFAAAAFTTIAFGLAVYFLGERLASEDRRLALDALKRSCQWLTRREDIVKTNHDAAGAAALAIGAKVTADKDFSRVARDKIESVLRRQESEGWFPEIGAMDLGYCSVLMDYVMLYVHFSGDTKPVPAMRKLMEFMAPHIHPDGTVAAEGGSCRNGYVGRIGTGLLSAHDDRAGALVSILMRQSPGKAGLLPTLADDLRFARWSHLPLLTDRLRSHFCGSDTSLFPEGWTIHPGCALAAFHRPGLDVYFTVAGGGSIRVFADGEKVIEDLGLCARRGNERLVSGYDRTRAILHDDQGIAMVAAMGEASFLYPGFLTRLALRLGATTALGSVWMRRAIDWYRLRTSTALNQSATSVMKSKGSLSHRRSLSFDTQTVAIVDHLEDRKGGATLSVDEVCTSRLPISRSESRTGNTLTITRRFDLSVLHTLG